MKITARLPVYVRGLPVRNNGHRDIFVSHDVPWILPEISRSETELAFETIADTTLIGGDSNSIEASAAQRKTDHTVVALKYEGDLYRRISRPSDDISHLFSRAFAQEFIGYPGVSIGSNISAMRSGIFSPDDSNRIQWPISLPIYKHMLWQIQSRSIRDTLYQSNELWPQIFKPNNERGFHGKRNTVTFEEILPKLIEYDHEQLEECHRTHRTHLDSFILIDGDLWMKTRPPVFKVRSWHYADSAPGAVVSVVFLPDWQDTVLTNTYFSLGARDQAFDYAQRLLDVTDDRLKLDGSPAGRGEIDNKIVPHLVHDDIILECDCEAEELRRMGSALAVETRRFLERNPKWKAKLTSEMISSVYRAYGEVLATNYVCGEYGDPAGWLQALVPAWKKIGRRTSLFEFGGVKLSDMLIERAISYEENTPVSLKFTNTTKPIR